MQPVHYEQFLLHLFHLVLRKQQLMNPQAIETVVHKLPVCVRQPQLQQLSNHAFYDTTQQVLQLWWFYLDHKDQPREVLLHVAEIRDSHREDGLIPCKEYSLHVSVN